jgi:hypothetical protein
MQCILRKASASGTEGCGFAGYDELIPGRFECAMMRFFLQREHGNCGGAETQRVNPFEQGSKGIKPA